MIANIRGILRAHPGLKTISISNMDGASMVCPPDVHYNQLQNSTGGANMLAVESIARALAKEFPDVLLQTLAYHGAQGPPLHLTFSPNVAIRFVASGRDKFQSLTHPNNAHIVEMVKRWRAVAEVITV